jgi:hypothetical protein
MSKKEDMELLAELVGTTQAEFKTLDQHIVNPSANLQNSSDAWNPHQVLKDGAAKMTGYMEQQLTAPVAQPGDAIPLVPPPQPVHQVAQQTYAQHIPPVAPAFVTDPTVIQRLDKIEVQLSKLHITFDKILNGILKNKTKQITIKFDDNKNSE